MLVLLLLDSFVLSKDGRALIGDEMGLGKTIQVQTEPI
jgi:SNF2 family DNA or RNA helicase